MGAPQVNGVVDPGSVDNTLLRMVKKHAVVNIAYSRLDILHETSGLGLCCEHQI